jgi:hypothetical protein
LTTGENDMLVIVVGPCATVVPAPPTLSLLSADASVDTIPIASSDAAPKTQQLPCTALISQLHGW